MHNLLPSLADACLKWPAAFVAPLVSVLLGAVALVLLAASLRRARQQLGAPRQRGVNELRSAHRDGLTGLANRQGFADALAGRLRARPATAVVLLDLDGFASINAALGSRAADEILVGVADRLCTLLPGPRELARIGGDTFGMMLDVGQGTEIAEAVCLQLIRALAEPLRVGTGLQACSASLGAAIAPEHGEDPDALLAAAQMALAEARSAGGGAWRIYAPERERRAKARAELSAALPDALARGLIVPHYQPIVELGTGKVSGLEVLARWNHPGRGLLAAEEFIGIAEQAGLAAQLTERLMRRVVADMRDLPPGLRYAFNVSACQLRELIAMVRNPPIWPEGVFDPARIAIEVTERALLDDVDTLREVFCVLHQRGTHVVLDDLGTGTASLAHLRELPFNAIKIDSGFVAGVVTDQRAASCVRAMLELGHDLRTDMVAEGVESPAVAECLTRMGCRFAQGFFYGGAVPGREVHGLLRRLAGICVGGRSPADALA